jgi:hypothetical protein
LIGGWNYSISFIDDAMRHYHILFLVGKGNAPAWIKGHVAKIKRQFGKAPRWMRFDNAEELVGKEVREFAEAEGIIIETTVPYSSSQNGITE